MAGALAVATTGAAADVAQPDCDTIWQRAGKGFYESNPTYVDPRDDSADWQFSTPAAQGINAATLDAGVNQLATNKSLLSVIVVRHGKLVYERYVNGGAVNGSNNVHSASKSILQALVGIAVQRGNIGSIDDKVSSYLPEYFVGAPASKRDITLRNLMSMASGLTWNEDRTENKIAAKPDWVGAILAEPMASLPGSTFNYSTGNTHVLSAVLQRATGMSTCEFAEQFLFSKIGITPEHWGRDPQGVNSGGYNLYLTPRELMKFGLLYLNDGVGPTGRVVPRSTVQQAKTLTFQTDPVFGYSQGWWMRTVSGHDMYFAWGWGGQFLYVIPDLDLVFGTTQKTADGFHNVEINSGQFIQDYLIPAVTGP
jgi:CubicO group peptidase (beta-lactamase class C family)